MRYLKYYFLRVIACAWLLFVNPASALTYPLPAYADSVVGQLQWTQALPGDTLSKIGRRYDIGYFELIEANPGVNFKHIEAGTLIIVPSRFILPPGPRKGIVINVAELRMYYYPADRPVVITYPVGIGREGWDTPLGTSWITQKMRNPTWIVPPSVRKDRQKEGIYLPQKVLPGPDNPLGGYAMRLKQLNYLIHGTNDSEGVGRRSSAGCLRLFPEDIESLYPLVKRKERVYIIDTPYKIGWDKDRLYLEAHVPLQNPSLLQPGIKRAVVQKWLKANGNRAANVHWQTVDEVVYRQNGMPHLIGVARKTAYK